MGTILNSTTRLNVLTSVLVAALGACTLSGCGADGDGTLGAVSGTVKLNGQPAANVGLEFAPKDGGRRSQGITDASGNYRLAYNPQNAGASIGGHTVSLNASGDVAEALAGKASLILTTEIEVTGGNNVIDFELSDLTVIE